MPSNAVARQHRAHPLRDLANCGKLHMASVCDGFEFKPHLRGSWGHGPNQHKRAVPRRGHGAKSLTSTGMLPHCVHEGPSTLGLMFDRCVMGSSSSHISGGPGEMALTSTSVLSHGGVMGPSP